MNFLNVFDWWIFFDVDIIYMFQNLSPSYIHMCEQITYLHTGMLFGQINRFPAVYLTMTQFPVGASGYSRGYNWRASKKGTTVESGASGKRINKNSDNKKTLYYRPSTWRPKKKVWCSQSFGEAGQVEEEPDPTAVAGRLSPLLSDDILRRNTPICSVCFVGFADQKVKSSMWCICLYNHLKHNYLTRRGGLDAPHRLWVA